MKTGVIGLGAMGMGMAMNLHQAGYLKSFWNRSSGSADELAAETGQTAAASPQDVAEQCELIIICVSRDVDVLEVANAMLPGVQKGAVIVDTSTVSSDTALEIADLLKQSDAQFLDSPVSGGVEGAKNGTMAMMVGGDKKVFELVYPMLSIIGGNIVHMGPSGSGQATKAVNQIMAAGINQAVTEALAFGEAMGLDMDKVIDVVGSGAAANWFLDHRGRTMLQDRFIPGFRVALHHKDLMICKKMAELNTGATLPTVEMTLADYQSLMDDGYGDDDISSLLRVKRKFHGS